MTRVREDAGTRLHGGPGLALGEGRPTRSVGARLSLAAAALLLAASLAPAARQTRVPQGAGGEDAASVEFEASRLISKARELLAAGQDNERAVRMLETVIEQYPTSGLRFEAALEIGRHYVGAKEYAKAIGYLNILKGMEQPDRTPKDRDLDLFLESQYLTGTAYFELRQYAAAFPVLRHITTQYPNTPWASQSYYYIGMCHFAQGNWSKAVETLTLVGTLVDPRAPGTRRAEAGSRFYVKIDDVDLPILYALGRRVGVDLTTARGDRESVECVPPTAGSAAFIGSIPSEIAPPRPGDNVLQVVGGDTVTVVYPDANTEDGRANVPRTAQVQIVSTAGAAFTLGDFETEASAAYVGQPLFVLVRDADRDTSDAPDALSLRLVARYKPVDTEDAAPTGKVDLGKLLKEEAAPAFRVRDAVTLTLRELGSNTVVRSGRFGGSVALAEFAPETAVDTNDAVLTAAVEDEIVLTYEDERHASGDDPRTVEAAVRVSGAIDTRPRATQDVVADATVRARKQVVEATAYLELARIFRSMGLLSGAMDRVKEGLDRVDSVVRTTAVIPSDVRQEALRIKWELHTTVDEFDSAIAACELFHKLYPDSPQVDQALMGMARVKTELKAYGDATRIYERVLKLKASQAKAEAQFHIAECREAEVQNRTGRKPSDEELQAAREAAVRLYKVCAERYPDSHYAGLALAKVIDYHIDQRDYGQASELLEQVFQDHPDANFLDAMLLKWTVVAYRAGDFRKAQEKASQLLFEYPASSYAAKVREVLPRIDAKLKGGAGGDAAAAVP